MPRFIVLGAAVLLGWCVGGLEAQSRLDLQGLIEEALVNNPSLEVLRQRVEIQKTRIPQAGALMDPMFRFELSNVPLSEFDFSSTPMSGKQFMLSQQLPYPGKLAAKERMTEHMAEAATAAYEDREGTIVNLVKQAYFSLAFLDRAIAVTHKNAALLQDFVRIAQTKYAVGNGLQQDVLKAQVSLSALKDKLIGLGQRRRSAEARLNTVLNRPPQNPVGLPDSLVQTPLVYSVEVLQDMAMAVQPRLKEIREQMRQWDAGEKLARNQYWPDFNVNLGYRQREFLAGDPVKGSDFLSLGVTLNLPIYRGRKQDQQVLEMQARRRQAVAAYEQVRQGVFLEIQQAVIDAEAHGEAATLFRTAIIPQADQSLASVQAGYQVDKVDFLTLLDSQITLFNFEIALYHHLAEYEKSLASLEAAVGKRLFHQER